LTRHHPTHRENPCRCTTSGWRAYPLQQITIKLQGTRHSDRTAIMRQLEKVVAPLKAAEVMGEENADDFGYVFEVNGTNTGPSFFGAPATYR